MDIHFNIELDNYTNKKGEKSVFIRCTQNRKHKRVNVGIQINPKYWDETQKCITKRHKLHKEYNAAIQQKMLELQKVYLSQLNSGEFIELPSFIQTIQKPQSQNFFDFAYKYKLEPIKSNKKLGTYRRYEAVLNKLKEFAGKSLTLNQMDYTLIREFEQYLLNEKKNSRDTVSSNLSVIRTIINEAEKHSLFSRKNPFNNISLKYTNNSKNKLTIEELKRFNSVELPDIQSLHLARDFFMACFYAAGTRAGDMATMKWSNIKAGNLVFTQIKTGMAMNFPILGDLEQIFSKYDNSTLYIFPLFKENEIVDERSINTKITYINKYIKEVCKYAGILKKISSHCARHSFSDISLSLNQNDIFGLRDMLGHTSVKTTEGYLQNRNYGQSKDYLQSIENLLK